MAAVAESFIRAGPEGGEVAPGGLLKAPSSRAQPEALFG